MSFNHPEFLFALFALLIPIVIHLFNFRRYKKVLFSNIEFLKNIKSETKKQNELKHLLILIFRMLAITFLVFVFAGPEFKSEKDDLKNSGPQTKIIYLDNSFSMSAQVENTRLFDLAIERVRNLAENSPTDTRFILMTNVANSGKRQMTREVFLSEIEQLKLSLDTRLLSNLLRSEKKYSGENNLINREVFLFSDFQKSSTDFPEFVPDTSVFYYFLPFGQSQKRNIYVDSCFIDSPVLMPGKRVNLFIRIKNGSDIAYEKVPIKLIIDGQQKGVAGVDLKARSQEIVQITFVIGEKGWHEGLITVDDSPVIFDNQLYFNLLVNNYIQVVELNNGQPAIALQKFYESDSIFKFRAMNYRQIDLNLLQKSDLVILNGLPEYSTGLLNQLTEFTNSGGNLLFFPCENITLNGSNELLKNFQAGEFISLNKDKTKVSKIKPEDELFREAIEKIPENPDFPVVYQHFILKYPTNSGIMPLVFLLNGNDFLVRKNVGNGKLYLFSAPFGKEYSNLSAHPLFIPIMYGATISNKTEGKLFYTIGLDNNLNTNISSASSGETPFSINNSSSGYSFIPEQQFISGRLNIDLYDNIPEAGIYSLKLNDSLFASYGFNYNRAESKMEFYSDEEIEKEMNDLGVKNYKIVDSENTNAVDFKDMLHKESDLWKLFVILALLMLLAEIIVLRYWK